MNYVYNQSPQAYGLLNRICSAYKDILTDTLTGIYIHGSLAMGCFRWQCSDIDFLVVVETQPSLSQKEALIQVLTDLNSEAPEKGFEMSVVLKQDCRHFHHPAPYVLHYSNSHLASIRTDLTRYCQNMHGLDPDLAAHFTITLHAGRVLCGPPICDIFAPVPPADYLSSIRYDIENAEEEICENPIYLILNLCRVLAFIRDGAILSKDQGGLWGQQKLPATYQSFARAARNRYLYDSAATFCESDLRAFARYMLHQIQGGSSL